MDIIYYCICCTCWTYEFDESLQI